MKYTHGEITSRLEEARDTLRRLPGHCFPSETVTRWPDVVRDYHDAYGYTGATEPLLRPSPKAIDRMEEAIAWFALIAAQPPRRGMSLEAHQHMLRNQSRAVWLMVACRMGERRASDRLHCSRWHAKTFRDDGLTAIERALNAGNTNRTRTSVAASRMSRYSGR